jgi:cell division septation protein DedD
MTRTDGEHELVLGNKQLLSAFFVVVALLGVFFTMGYFVGKNTATAGFNAGQPGSNGGARPDAAGKALDSGTTAASVPPDSTSPAADPNAAAPVAPPPETTEAKPETPAPAPAPAAVTPTEPAPSKDDAIAQPSKEEMYLQVSAVRRPDADNMVKILRERGFPALLGESSKQGLFRVLVGPFKTHGDMGRAKADLKAKGFDSIVAK